MTDDGGTEVEGGPGAQGAAASEAERAAGIEATVRLLHVTGARAHHGDVEVLGNRRALEALAEGLGRALDHGRATVEAMASDGEGYHVIVELDDRPWSHEGWERRRAPYTEPWARGEADPGADAILLRHALRQANAMLFKRGAKPVPDPTDRD